MNRNCQQYMDHLHRVIKPLQDQLAHHEVYSCIRTMEDVQIFMQYHVFAVWDFMYLLKSLQGLLTCISVPWLPVGNPESRRLINEIVTAEESDENGNGSYMSHFEMYYAAMKQCGANTSSIDGFLKRIRSGHSVLDTLRVDDDRTIPRRFVETTWRFVRSASPHRIAAAFGLGREEIIPDMFKALVSELNSHLPNKLSQFKHYLERHIEVDGNHHKTMACQLLMNLCGEDPQKWAEAEKTTLDVLQARVDLWKDIVSEIKR